MTSKNFLVLFFVIIGSISLFSNNNLSLDDDYSKVVVTDFVLIIHESNRIDRNNFTPHFDKDSGYANKLRDNLTSRLKSKFGATEVIFLDSNYPSVFYQKPIMEETATLDFSSFGKKKDKDSPSIFRDKYKKIDPSLGDLFVKVVINVAKGNGIPDKFANYSVSLKINAKNSERKKNKVHSKTVRYPFNIGYSKEYINSNIFISKEKQEEIFSFLMDEGLSDDKSKVALHSVDRSPNLNYTDFEPSMVFERTIDEKKKIKIFNPEGGELKDYKLKPKGKLFNSGSSGSLQRLVKKSEKYNFTNGLSGKNYLVQAIYYPRSRDNALIKNKKAKDVDKNDEVTFINEENEEVAILLIDNKGEISGDIDGAVYSVKNEYGIIEIRLNDRLIAVNQTVLVSDKLEKDFFYLTGGLSDSEIANCFNMLETRRTFKKYGWE